jgi:sec-independent protein translocase protein TatC
LHSGAISLQFGFAMPAALSPAPRPPSENGKMSFLEHLDELRKRIIHAAIALLVGMAASFFFMEQIAEFVLAPTRRALPVGSDLIFTKPTEGVSIYLDIALMAGLILAAPVIMYQVWLFVVPALYANERKYAVPFVALAAFGTVAGAAFGHYGLYPAMMGFFATFTFAGIKFMPRLEEAFSLYVRLIIAMVLVFQIPTLAFVLARLRLLTARFMWVNIKYAVLIILVVAAVLTPSPDPWNQALFAAPMFALYLIGIVVAWFAQPKPRANEAGLRLVFAAAVLDRAWKQHRRPRARWST